MVSTCSATSAGMVVEVETGGLVFCSTAKLSRTVAGRAVLAVLAGGGRAIGGYWERLLGGAIGDW